MKHWPVQDAKARFSEMLEASVNEGPQVVTRRGVETAVLVPIEEWKRLNAKPGRTLKELLLADEPRFDFELPRRGTGRWREPPTFD
jgi:prevent-host-death family protein